MAMQEKVKFLSYNQNHKYFACAFDNSVRMFGVEPLRELFHIFSNEVGTMAIAEILQRSDVAYFVSGGNNPKCSEKTVFLYKMDPDEGEKNVPLHITYSSEVLSVRVTHKRIVTAHMNEIQVCTNLDHFEFVCKIETRDNPLGLLVMTPGEFAPRTIICFPSKKCGEVRIVDLSDVGESVSQPPAIIAAHTNELACMSLNQEGNLLATASKHGTLIRVWDTIKRVKVAELRRGADPATLYCINFSGDSDFLCCSSDKGTVHIFALKDTKLNRKSTLSGMGLGDYVESQWALANFSVRRECACICAFGPNSAVYAVCYDGSFHKYVYTAEGTCNRVSFDMFPELCEHWEALFG